jgi:hypothetical protein
MEKQAMKREKTFLVVFPPLTMPLERVAGAVSSLILVVVAPQGHQ